MNYSFCNNENNLLHLITKNLSANLFKDVSGNSLKQRYSEMIVNFGKPVSEWERIPGSEYEYAEYKDMKIPVDQILEPQLKDALNIGIDLPTWFNFKKENKKIMVVGMEPLRRYDAPGYATISSPFGLHHYHDKKSPSRNLMYKFIRELTEADFGVYITDISKLYFLINNRKQAEPIERSATIFTGELTDIKPDIILPLGVSAGWRLDAVLSISGYRGKFQLHRLTHPAARKGDKHYFNTVLELSNNFE